MGCEVMRSGGCVPESGAVTEDCGGGGVITRLCLGAVSAGGGGMKTGAWPATGRIAAWEGDCVGDVLFRWRQVHLPRVGGRAEEGCCVRSCGLVVLLPVERRRRPRHGRRQRRAGGIRRCGAACTGIWVVAGAVIIGCLCGWAVGCGCVNTTGAPPVVGIRSVRRQRRQLGGLGERLVVRIEQLLQGRQSVRALCGLLLTSGYASSCARRSVGEVAGMAARDARQ